MRCLSDGGTFRYVLRQTNLIRIQPELEPIHSVRIVAIRAVKLPAAPATQQAVGSVAGVHLAVALFAA